MCEAVPDRVYFLSKKGKRILKIGRKVYERGIYLVKFCIHSFPLSVLPRSRPVDPGTRVSTGTIYATNESTRRYFTRYTLSVIIKNVFCYRCLRIIE